MRWLRDVLPNVVVMHALRVFLLPLVKLSVCGSRFPFSLVERKSRESTNANHFGKDYDLANHINRKATDCVHLTLNQGTNIMKKGKRRTCVNRLLHYDLRK